MSIEMLNKSLLQAIRESVPKNTNMASVLMDALHMGKEAAYRRLRNEVPLSFAEAAVLSGKLGISLDRIVGNQVEERERALLDLHMIRPADPLSSYTSMIGNYTDILCRSKPAPLRTRAVASNTIPRSLYFKYPQLSRFFFFKWLYQSGHPGIKQFGDVKIPPEMMKKQLDFIAESRRAEKTLLILDSTVFQSALNEVLYFARIGVLVPEEIDTLLRELRSLLEELEQIACSGVFESGRPVQLYVSEIDFDATYSYTEGHNLNLTFIHLFSLNSIMSFDEHIFRTTKAWIQSLKKFSTLISESGEVQRVEFFKKQHKLIDEYTGVFSGNV